VGSTFTVQVVATDAANLANAPFTLVYDPLFLEFVGAAEGDLLKKDGKPASLKTSVDKENGQVAVTLGRAAGTGGVSGSGTLLTAQFRAKSKGPASLGFTGVNLTDAAGKRQEAVPYNTIVEVQ
jgi:general secretion pathway protein D